MCPTPGTKHKRFQSYSNELHNMTPECMAANVLPVAELYLDVIAAICPPSSAV
jgi:hypothetical protein